MFKTTANNIQESSPFPINTIEMNDVEMDALKTTLLNDSDKTPYVVCNVEDSSNKIYFQWSGTEWISWKCGMINDSMCITTDATLTPPEITTNQNNYNPTGLVNVSGSYLKTYIRLNASSGNKDVTGLIAPSGNCNVVLYVLNYGSNDLKFKNNSASSVAENRFLLRGGEVKIKDNEMIIFIYDRVVQRWKVISKH